MYPPRPGGVADDWIDHLWQRRLREIGKGHRGESSDLHPRVVPASSAFAEQVAEADRVLVGVADDIERDAVLVNPRRQVVRIRGNSRPQRADLLVTGRRRLHVSLRLRQLGTGIGIVSSISILDSEGNGGRAAACVLGHHSRLAVRVFLAALST
jgi:hypothetical protein